MYECVALVHPAYASLRLFSRICSVAQFGNRYLAMSRQGDLTRSMAGIKIRAVGVVSIFASLSEPEAWPEAVRAPGYL